jgi:hypothetical protein
MLIRGFRTPVPDWMLDYRKEWLGSDFIAGLTAAAEWP